MLQSVNHDNFEKLVLQAPGLVLVDFWSPTCGPCEMYNTVLEQFLNDSEESVSIVKVNVDEEITLANQQQILVMPTTQVFYQGECVKTILGVQSQDDLNTIIKNLGVEPS